MRLDEARAQFESRFTLGPLGNSARSPTGEPYVEVCSGGLKLEAETAPCLCTSESAAVRLWLDAINCYAAAQTGILYWRIVPELVSHTYLDEDWNTLSPAMREFARRPTWFVYSRLLISAKPALTAAA